MMEGRRYSDGLHQALEAKEHVDIQRENQTLASITFQNYFRLYPKLAGMTGTALTEAAEFAEIYGSTPKWSRSPTNVDVRRDNMQMTKSAAHPLAGINMTPSSTSSPNAVSASSLCWSAPFRLRNPKRFRKCSRNAASRIT